MDVGFIGLGGMGRPMVANLIRAGHTVRVWNRSPEPVKASIADGAVDAGSLAGVWQADVVISMLADDASVRAVLLDDALLAGARSSVHVNMATISVALAREAAELHATHGIGYVSAPVLGRIEVATAGKLNILASGPASLLERVEPLFAAMGQRTWPLGDGPEQAVITKISANFMIASAIEAMGEAAALTEAHGVDPGALVDLLTNSIFPGVVYTVYGNMIKDRRYEPANFRVPLGLKDVTLGLTAGFDARVPMPFAGILRDHFLDAIAHGDADRDWGAVAEVSRRRANLPRES
ncbi:3-hydroxyisobutyrate dehydrogenase-like beta-hydroxyacid dehydrogenase [Catenuloplanes nepalensis]|uniref:3-hydroxyisobutyrate dehydrogenase-like beta-hydroxyacid dehydrogenase n=1 Tax=Catenuloplanes nepalensis TaxID=587533 RepID=A0ABT9MZV2_9ACTN|nr:NAD(P)-dependent oxidoreductase [Catenuloplanes nepalensis]MDP9796726.1 3-hydroxyisobutyrate dehydrogenase-like beta-hydroxyacid dehydrogenase [Catenuloplanes nepalensis]